MDEDVGSPTASNSSSNSSSNSNSNNPSSGVSPRRDVLPLAAAAAGGAAAAGAPAAAAARAAAAAAGRGGCTLEHVLFSRFRLLGQLAAKALLDGRSSTTDTGLHALFWELVARPLLQQQRLRPCGCMRPTAAAAATATAGPTAATVADDGTPAPAAAAAAAGVRFGVCCCGATAAAVAAIAAVDEGLARSLQGMLDHRETGHEVTELACYFVLPRT